MGNIIDFNTSKNNIKGEMIGAIHVFTFIDKLTNKPFFYIKSDNKDVLPISYVIENSLYNIKTKTRE